MPGLNDYATSLPVKKNPQDLTPGQNIPDPTKNLTQQGTDYSKTVSRNLNNPGAPITAIGGRVQQDVMDNLNNPDKNRSEFGDIADTNLRKEAASGQLYGVDNLRAQTERANAQNASRSTTQTQEALASQGIRPGTAGYARALAQNNAGVNSQNLDRTQQLNMNEMAASKDINARLGGREALAGSRYTTALNNAGAYEQNAQNAQQTALGQAKGIEDTAYNKGQTAYTQGETARLENKNAQTALINSVGDPKIKAILQGIQAQGGDVNAAYTTLTGTAPNAQGNLNANAGTFNSNFASLNPSQVEKQGLLEQAKAYNPQNPGETTAAYEQRINDMVNKMGNQIFTSKNAPLTTQEEQRTAKGITEKLNTLPPGQTLDDADFKEARKQGLVKQFTPTTIPRGPDAVNTFLKDNPSGIISLNGEQYRVIKGDTVRTGRTQYTLSPRHTDAVEVKTADGQTKYIYDDKIQDNPPKSVDGQSWDDPSGWFDF